MYFFGQCTWRPEWVIVGFEGEGVVKETDGAKFVCKVQGDSSQGKLV